MTVAVTGGAGFLGTRLIELLLASSSAPSRIVSVDRVACPVADPRVESLVGSITEPQVARRIVEASPEVIWHLAAVLSGQSEAEFELGFAVNVGGTRGLLDACRDLPRPPRFVFSSTVAVFGGPLPDIVPEDFVLRPQSSYGTAKAVAELLVLEYSRRGLIDGIVCRVPTVAVRPGAPNSAVSGFVSGIVREPMNGMECTCPVPLDTPLWVSSPAVTTRNLAHAGALGREALGVVRSVNMPGISVTPAQLLDSLERVAGRNARALVGVQPDAHVSAMIGSWPAAFDVTRALALGFERDRDADGIVTQFAHERMRT